jgi:hypothetical protein
MKRISRVGFAAATAACVIAALPFAAGRAEDDASPIFGVRIPAGYRQWELIAPSHVPGFDELRGILGNPVAMTAYRAGTLPFPDGTVLAKLAWKHVPSADFDGAFAPGPATTVQFMVKDANKYPATGGWGFGKFVDGKPVGEAEHKECFACHAAHVKDHDFVFTRFAPSATGFWSAAPARARAISPWRSPGAASAAARAGASTRGAQLHAECLRAVQGAAKLCGSLGHVVEEADPKLDMVALRLELAERELDRAQALKRRDFGTGQNVDQRTAEKRAAQAALDDAQAQIRDAQFDLEHCRITASVTGRIGKHLVSVGNLVAGSRAATSPTTLLATLVSLDPIYLDFDMSESDFLTFSRDRALSKGKLADKVGIALSDEAQFTHQGTLDFVDNVRLIV